MFPADEVPDGSFFAPHHFLWGAYLVLFVAFVAWDDRERKPVAAVGGVLASLFGWYHVWRFYPVYGATLVLTGVGVATAAVLGRRLWREYPRHLQALALVFLLVAIDDAVDHAFVVGTSLDWLWEAHLLPVMQ